MTTSGVQITGVRGAGGISVSTKAAGRDTVGSSSFADMVSSNLSAQKDGTSASPKTDGTAKADRTDAVQKTEPVSDAKETVMTPEKEPAANVDTKAEGKATEKNIADEPMPQDDAAPEESAVPDTQFPKSLKLFKEASELLEAQKLNELKQAVMDSLDIDEDELRKILEQLGVNMQELLQPQILQQVVVQAQGAGDMAVLLTNETAMNNLKELLAKADELMASLQTTETVAEDAGETEPIQEMQEEVPRFEELLDDGENQRKEIVGELNQKVADDQKPANAAETRTEEKNGFSFEAVKESTRPEQAREDSSSGRSGAGDAKTKSGGMAEQFLDLVTNAASKDEVAFSQLSRGEQVREVAQQILERVRVFVGETQTSMEISLTPESLGRVTLNLVSRQGALTAHFTAQNQIAKEAIESQIVVLRENLESQGLKVEAIEVTVSNFDFTQNGGAQANDSGQGNRQRRRGVTLEEAVNAESNIAGVREAEEIAADMMERNGNQLDYTA